jgi:hypothetical protein
MIKQRLLFDEVEVVFIKRKSFGDAVIPEYKENKYNDHIKKMNSNLY